LVVFGDDGAAAAAVAGCPPRDGVADFHEVLVPGGAGVG
jgi:hypothetical protein